MSEQTYKLLSWQGDVQGTFSAEKILEMWESEEITGLYQVVTETGNLSVQEFAGFAEEVAEKNRQHQQQVAEAQAEAENQRQIREQMKAEAAQRIELERQRIDQERTYQPQSKTNLPANDKIYFIYLDDEKKGPFSKQNLQVMYRGGKVEDSTQVWTEDLGEWVELRGFKEIVGSRPSSASGISPGIPVPTSPTQHVATLPAKPEPPDGLIATLWILAISDFLFPLIFGNVLTLGGFFIIRISLNLAFIVVAIILCCSSSTKGRVNGIVGVILFTIGWALSFSVYG